MLAIYRRVTQSFMFFLGIFILIIIADFSLRASAADCTICAVRFDPSGEHLAVGKDDGTVLLWSKKEKAIQWESREKPAPVFLLFFRERGRQIIVVRGTRGTPIELDILDVSTGKLIQSFSLPRTDQEYYPVITVGPSGNILALGSHFSSVVEILEFATTLDSKSMILSKAKTLYSFEDSAGKCGITDVCFCASGNLVIATTKAGHLLAWNIHAKDDEAPLGYYPSNFVYLRKVGRSGDELRGLGCSETNILMTVGTWAWMRYGQVQLWKADEGIMLDFIKEAHPGIVRRVAIAKNGNFAVTTGEIWHILWKIKDGQLIQLAKIFLGKHVMPYDLLSAVDFTKDGNEAAIGTISTVFIVKVPSLEVIGHIGASKEELLIKRYDGQSRESP